MKIINETRLEKQIKNLVKILKLENVLELRVELNEELSGTPVSGRMREFEPNKFVIQLDPEAPRNKMIKVLAHEMIHVAQYDRGDLAVINNKVFWKGEDLSHLPYSSMPWEIEAFSRMNAIAQQSR